MIRLGRFRARRQSATVPEQEQCSFCSQPSVEVSHRPIFDDPHGQPAYEVTQRCIDHPPPRCGTCGRTYWPDFLHLDCGDEEVASETETS